MGKQWTVGLGEHTNVNHDATMPMKSNLRNATKFICFAFGLFLATAASVCAQSNVYSGNVVGYANITFLAGDNLFGNPLDFEVTDSSQLVSANSLNNIFTIAADGSALYKWDSTARQFLTPSIFHDGSWSINYDLAPGEGALLRAPSPFVNTFVGTVLTGPGPADINPPIPPSRGDGFYLLSSLFPASARTFQDVIARAPNEGESVTFLDAHTQNYSTTTFHQGAWDNGDPALEIAGAAFYNLGGVQMNLELVGIPEPGTGALALAAFFLFSLRRCLPRARVPSSR